MALIYTLLLMSTVAVVFAVGQQRPANYSASFQCNRFPSANKFCEGGVVPDVLPSTPASVLQVAFSDNARVILGNRLARDAAKKTPTIKIQQQPTQHDAGDKTLYTLVMVGKSSEACSLSDNGYRIIYPDAPSRTNPVNGQWLHWLVVDHAAPSYEPTTTDCIDGQDLSTIMCYKGPSPPQGSGEHRYIILLYKQRRGPIKSQVRIDGRPHFNVTQFAERNGLELLAGNFFIAQNPDESS